MNTVIVDIQEKDLINFTQVVQFSLDTISKDGHKELFKQFPFTLYRERTCGNHMITMQIPLMEYILFLGYGLVK